MADVDTQLEQVENLLKSAYAGYKQFQDAVGPERKRGLHNAIVFGRSVTFALQNLRGDVDGFDEWYEARKQVLKEDDVAAEMNRLRSKILKQGEDGVNVQYRNVTFSSEQLWAHAPPWADSVFFGDQYGGMGFEVETPDGETRKYYMELPDSIEADVRLYFEGLQEDELGDVSEVEDDLKYYLQVLAEIVADAKEEFGTTE